MIFAGIGIGVLLTTMFFAWVQGVEPSPKRPPDI